MRSIFWAVMAVLIVVAFDRAMAADRENLCSNDATAFEGCN
jgi:hypothetical protein